MNGDLVTAAAVAIVTLVLIAYLALFGPRGPK